MYAIARMEERRRLEKLTNWCAAALTAFFIGLFAGAQPSHAQPATQGASATNVSATITTGNTFQQVLASGPRRAITVQNNNATDACWIAFGTTGGVPITAANASKGISISLPAGASWQRYYIVPDDPIIATCASNGDTLYIETE